MFVEYLHIYAFKLIGSARFGTSEDGQHKHFSVRKDYSSMITKPLIFEYKGECWHMKKRNNLLFKEGGGGHRKYNNISTD